MRSVAFIVWTLAQPDVSQTCHWKLNVIGFVPRHTPGLARSTCPSFAVPSTCGGCVLAGADAEVLPGAASASGTQTHKATSAAPAIIHGLRPVESLGCSLANFVLMVKPPLVTPSAWCRKRSETIGSTMHLR